MNVRFGSANLTIARSWHGHRDYPLSLGNVEDLLHERDVDIPPAEAEERCYAMLDQLAIAAQLKPNCLPKFGGGSLHYLPPYSPDFNPIEMAFSKRKALLRKASERAIGGLWDAIGRFLGLFLPKECRNDFNAACYDPT